ncbi:hypothetical protein LEP1GSC075_3162 [Leptospira interrogans str. Kito]|nr:hypothetical protein LEP1GSC099_2153 [Leptospira interrogans str. UI 08452]EMK19320.1 hypothetical protein LEP1GSC075_3162 [Leptospira interrogans str. Kito]EMN34434.1 hypothetical protein LEP1GSC084_1336 [Leptospira interrogans serovar Medanensis str. L0448]EMN38629.1 hypothetical protein LEP1GSC085_0451 [Leptospira interrogans str. L0996]EMN96820.1 hypothetical protein LEP1GSC110_4469 [Leptospira interrogans serovar Medanensis str. UT053]
MHTIRIKIFDILILLFSNKKNLISETNHFEQQNSFYLSILYFTRLPYSHRKRDSF